MQKIELTDRRPIQINPENWPVIASAKSWEGQYEFQAFRKWKIFVRQKDTRYIVYGYSISDYANDDSRSAGYVLESDTDLIATIKTVANQIGDESLAHQCITDLPTEELD